MKTKSFALLFAAAMLFTLACGLIDTALNSVTGGENMKTVAQLWSDVPRIDGLQQSDMDMPLGIKLVMRAVIGNLGRLNKEGEDRTTGNIDWIVFTTNKTPDDVKKFYTNARMKASGWVASDNSTCLSGSEQGFAEVGLFCAFLKEQGNKETALIIIAAADDKTKQTNLFFLRIEAEGTPVPKKAD